MKSYGSRFFYLSLIVVGVLYFATYKAGPLDKDKKIIQVGQVSGATCIKDRSLNGIGFLFRNESEPEGSGKREFIQLPIGYVCNEALISRFEDGPVTLTYVGTRVVGVDIRGATFIDSDNANTNISPDSGYKLFSFALFVILIFVVLVSLLVTAVRRNN